jgi:hypothetical protein
MSYPKQTMRVQPRRGVSSDVPAWALADDLVSQADNIIFREGIPQRAPSVQAVYDPPTVGPYCLLNAQISGTNFWIYAGSSAVYAVQTTVHTDVTHASGIQTNTDVSKFTLDLLNGVPVFNNALDEPQYWDGNVANNFLDLPGWIATETCKVLVPHRFHLFALGIDGPAGDFPDQVKWSDAAAPGNVPSSWTAAATNEAGDTILGDTPGEIISGANLRDALMIYKSGSTHRADYVGGQEIYAFRTLFVEAGALCRHAVADINGRHLVVTDGDIIVTDGTNIRSIAQNRRKRFLFNQLDQDNFQNLFVVYNRALNECWVCFPEAGNSLCTRAMVYDVANDAWGDRELPGIAFAANGLINDTATDETWDADSDAWDGDSSPWNQVNYSLATADLVLADPTTPDLLEVGRGTQSLTSTLSKYSMGFGEPGRFKFLKRVHFLIDAETAIDFEFRIGTQQAAEGTITWQAPVTFNSDDQFVNVLATGRFVSWELKALTDSPFRVTDIAFEYEWRGYH